MTATPYRRLEHTLQLAEQLGADVRRLSGNDFVEEILKFAAQEHATQIVIGVSSQEQAGGNGHVRRCMRRWLKRMKGIALHLVTGDER